MRAEPVAVTGHRRDRAAAGSELLPQRHHHRVDDVAAAELLPPDVAEQLVAADDALRQGPGISGVRARVLPVVPDLSRATFGERAGV